MLLSLCLLNFLCVDCLRRCGVVDDSKVAIRLKWTDFWRGFNGSSALITWLDQGSRLFNRSLRVSTNEEYDVHLLSVFGKFDWSVIKESKRFFLLYSGENYDRYGWSKQFLKANLSNIAVISHEHALGRPHVFRVPSWFFRHGHWGDDSDQLHLCGTA